MHQNPNPPLGGRVPDVSDQRAAVVVRRLLVPDPAPPFDDEARVDSNDLPAGNEADAIPAPPRPRLGGQDSGTDPAAGHPAAGSPAAGSPAAASAGSPPARSTAPEAPPGQRDPAGRRSDPAGRRSDPAGAQRDPAGAERDPAGAERDPAGAQRDPAGAERDPAGAERDPADGQRDPADGSWPGQFAQVLAETLAGARPQRQLTPWTTEQARRRIRELGPMLTTSQRPQVRRVMTSAPAPDVLELTAVVGFGHRVRVLAVRLEREQAPGRSAAGRRWCCTAIESA